MKTFYIVDIDDTILDIKGFVENSFGLEIKAIKEKEHKSYAINYKEVFSELKKINVYDAQNGAQLHEPARVFMRNAHKQGSLVVFVSSNISKKTSKQKAEFAKYLIDEYGLAYDSNIGYFRMCENYSEFKKIVDSIKLSRSSPLLVDDSDERLGYASFLGVDYVMKKQPWNKCYEEEAVVVF